MESSEKVVAEQIRNIHAILNEFRGNIAELRKVVDEEGKWRAATEEVLESMSERIDIAADEVDKLKVGQTSHQSFIDQFRGGKMATAQLVVTVGILGGVVATLVTVLTKLR